MFQIGFNGLFHTFMDLLWKLMMVDDWNQDNIALMVTVALSIWCTRNEVQNGGKKKFELELVHGARVLLQEYKVAILIPDKPEHNLIECWFPPEGSLYKVNVDGAVFSAQKESGIGVIIRDKASLVVATMSKKVKASLGPLEIEAKAFEVSLQFAKDMGLQEFILEGDSLNVYRALAGLSPSPAVVAPIVFGILDSCQEVWYVRFPHMRRKGNRPAHLLTKYVVGIVDYFVWMEENSCFLKQALHRDILSFVN